MKKNYIGLATTFHDSAIVIVNANGKVVFAEATERYLQNKRAMQMRPDVFRYAAKVVAAHCDADAELVISCSWSDGVLPRLREQLMRERQAYEKLAHMRGDASTAMRSGYLTDIFETESSVIALTDQGHQLAYELRNTDPDRQVSRRGYEHHRTHAAAGCYTSPFNDAVCLIVDGHGEDSAYSCFSYANGKLSEVATRKTHEGSASLGAFYAAVCEACGFDAWAGEEWKVMGLAPYGQHDPESYEVLREMIKVEGLNLVAPSQSRKLALAAKLKKMGRKAGAPALSVANLAFTGQQVFSEVLFELVNNVHALGISDNLVIGGGCALNSSANGRVLKNSSFKAMHVFSAPADDGNAIGAAMLAYHDDHPDARPAAEMQSPYLGSRMSPETIRNVRDFSGLPKMTMCNGDAPRRAAELLARNKIIGWIQGQAEFGPRALGNRSILADPRSSEVKLVINERVKFREEFRPFAPSILSEYGRDFFEDYAEAPYMERTLRFRDSVKHLVPGVVHEDGTGRLQTVYKAWNPRYYELIEHFHALTGVPLVLNTSFNVMGKPISHSVEDALAVFFTSGLDAIFIEDLLIEK